MSDANKFINTYIDIITTTLHEQLGSGLQLKTQLKLLNDLLQEKDGVIAQLNVEIENVKNSSINQSHVDSIATELAACNDRLKIAEDSHNALKTKVSHMDTLTRQLADMKNEIKVRDDTIANIKAELNTKDAQISSLNNTISEKDNEISRLTSKLESLTPKAKSSNSDKSVKESSTVKVQLNTKSKPKELPIDDDF